MGLPQIWIPHFIQLVDHELPSYEHFLDFPNKHHGMSVII